MSSLVHLFPSVTPSGLYCTFFLPSATSSGYQVKAASQSLLSLIPSAHVSCSPSLNQSSIHTIRRLRSEPTTHGNGCWGLLLCCWLLWHWCLHICCLLHSWRGFLRLAAASCHVYFRVWCDYSTLKPREEVEFARESRLEDGHLLAACPCFCLAHQSIHLKSNTTDNHQNLNKISLNSNHSQACNECMTDCGCAVGVNVTKHNSASNKILKKHQHFKHCCDLEILARSLELAWAGTGNIGYNHGKSSFVCMWCTFCHLPHASSPPLSTIA